MTRTVVFGLDGACYSLIQPWLEDGGLPTLKRLMERGSRSDLESTVPATTPPAWTSLTTGMNPGKHGVYGFYSRRKGSYETVPVSDRDVHARRLWDYLSNEDLTSIVVNVPVTHPARELDGALIPGYMAQDEPDTHPAALLDDIGLDYHVYAEDEAGPATDELLQQWLRLTESRKDAALALMERYDWDLLFLEFQKTDGVVHKFTDKERMRRIYERVDRCMRDVLEGIDGDPNVFVVSDHGIGQPKQWSVVLNTWLVKQGYAKTKTADTPKQDSWEEQAAGGTDEERRNTFAAVLGAAGRLGVTKQGVERVLSRLSLYEIAARLAPEGAGDSLQQEVVDRRASLAFYEGTGFSGVDVGVTINSRDFYPEGVVASEDYDDLREELIQELEAFRGPNGEQAFRRVRKREEVYHGAQTELAPDIVLEQSRNYVIGSKHPRGQTFIPAEKGRIDHTRHGLLVAAGPDIRTNWSPEGTPSIHDVTPTLLHLHDLPLNHEFDGEPLDILTVNHEPGWKDYPEYTPPETRDVSGKEEEKLRERLRGMGYLE